MKINTFTGIEILRQIDTIFFITKKKKKAYVLHRFI